jgi:hypothetical protein
MNREIVDFFDRKLPPGQTRQTTVRRNQTHAWWCAVVPDSDQGTRADIL